MAYLQRLAARHIRNLQPFSLAPHPRFNIVYGRNASGKTSLLEAVHIAGYGRSFRGQLRHVIRHSEEALRLHADVARPEQPPMTLVVEHRQGRTSLSGNGAGLGRASELAHILPVLLINTDSHNVIAGGPQQRRRMLDWGVFHVEHRYATVLSRYQNALRQRNLCLQDGPRATVPAHIWDDELAAGAIQIDELRRRYLADWLPFIECYLGRLLVREDVQVIYAAGWDEGAALIDVLRRDGEADRRAGYTRNGPHRANLTITVADVPAEHCLSRGQQKLMVFALAFAQAAALHARRGEPCVMLIDDLAAELDQAHRELAMEALAALGGQAFVTVTEDSLLPPVARETGSMFHVEHGTAVEML